VRQDTKVIIVYYALYTNLSIPVTVSQRLAVMLHHPSSMVLGMLAKKTCAEDTEHCQARVRLSKATWGNVIATRYQSLTKEELSKKHTLCKGGSAV
jgi:hypothetical protein